ncbi:MAG: hypothetical protein ACTHMS_07735 [Jatrophihabitans sp.]|uniref:hypothetical protein n=1 Tax=Jatrophihabitans sp. TaxID=1932789 RepID=UPI003F7DFE97
MLVLTRSGRLRTVGGVHLRPTSRSFETSYAPGRRLIRLAPAARAVADFALWSNDPRKVRAAVTASIQRGRVGVADLVREYEQGPRNGSHWLRQALKDAIAGAKSIAEADASQRMTAARVPTYELNVPVHNEFGELLFEVDVLWRMLRAVLEVDSREYHLDEAAWLATMAKHKALTVHGIALVHDAPSVIKRPGWGDGVREFVRRRAVELGLPAPSGRGPFVRPPGEAPPPLVIPGLRRPKAFINLR